MNQKSVEQHWNEVTAGLLPLRRLLSGSTKAQEIFDEFVEHNELELALHTVCDFLLEREEVAIMDRDVETIEILHEQMQITDECCAAIRRHIIKNS